MSLLVVGAWEPELERFRVLADRELGRKQGAGLTIEPVGIGMIDAAVGMTRSLARHRPSRVLLLGTCGAAPGSRRGIHDVVVATSVSLVDAAVLEGRAALPYGPLSIQLDAPMAEVLDAAAGAGSVRSSRATVTSLLGITIDDDLAATLARLGDVEHLEAYGVARACQVAGVPCGLVLGIANLVGSRGRDEWKANHVTASARAAEVAASALSRLA